MLETTLYNTYIASCIQQENEKKNYILCVANSVIFTVSLPVVSFFIHLFAVSCTRYR